MAPAGVDGSKGQGRQKQQQQQQGQGGVQLLARSAVDDESESEGEQRGSRGKLVAKAGGEADAARPPLLAMDKLQHNMKAVMYGRSSLTIVAGLVAGILGCTGLLGFLVYVAAMGACSAAFLLKTGLKPTAYFDVTSRVVTEGFFGGLLSFILFWTLAYDIVHIF